MFKYTETMKDLLNYWRKEIEKNPKDLSFNQKKYSIVDLFVQHEGEIAFVNLLQELKEYDFNVKTLKKTILKMQKIFLKKF